MRGTDKRGGGSEGRDEKTIPKKGEKWSFHQETCHRLNLPFSVLISIPFFLLIFSLSVLCMLFCLFSDFKTEKCVLVNTKSCQLLLNLIDLDVNGASFCAQTWQHEVVKNITLGFGLSSSATVAIKFFYHHCVKKKQKKQKHIYKCFVLSVVKMCQLRKQTT